jgi:hypothetical protein
MARSHRPNPAVDTPSLAHELKLFISALIIGLVLGVGGSALWHQRQDPPSPPELMAAVTAQKTCQKNLAGAQKQLGQCQRELKLEQLKPSSTPPAPSFAPALTVNNENIPKPKPEAAPSEATPAPITAAPTPLAVPLTWPKGLPPAPKPKPGAQTSLNIQPPTLPTPTLGVPAPSLVSTETTIKHRIPSPRPTVIPPRAATPAPEAAPRINLADASSLTINVGEEKVLSAEHNLRLIAVSKRKTGSICVLAGNGLASTRVPSGKSQTANWSGSRVMISATVQDSDTCRVSVRPD